MGSYINFRDVGNVFAAGGALQASGDKVLTGVTNDGSALQSQEAGVFTKKDSFSEPFRNETYAAKGEGGARNEDIFNQSKKWAKIAKEMGDDVVKAATRIVWQDALAGAELATAMKA
jgi:hypothetical protein